MTFGNVLPAFSDCLDQYLSTYERFGTDPFTREQLHEGTEDGELDRLLDLSVAYGLLGFDGAAYHVRFEPNAPVTRWEDWAEGRAQSIRDEIADRSAGDGGDPGVPDAEPEQLVHAETAFASVVVDDTDDFEQVADSVATAVETNPRGSVVLRSAGDRADRVQRLADRLCDPEVVADSPLSRPLDKEYTDVVGRHKDELEFRLYLTRA